MVSMRARWKSSRVEALSATIRAPGSYVRAVTVPLNGAVTF
jgi:hypothetical protein